MEGKVFYFVSWENYPMEESTWISREDFTDVSSYSKFDVKMSEKMDLHSLAETKWQEQKEDLMSRILFEEEEAAPANNNE